MLRRPFAVMVLAAASCGAASCGGSGSPGDDDDDIDAGEDPACQFHTPADDVAAPAIHTPRWAFRPWISKDISDGADTLAFVEGFRTRDIPVGAVVIDSPWETHYNTFVPNEDRYPDFEQMVRDLQADDIRVILWITQMLNTSGLDLEPGGDEYEGPSPNFAEAERCDFLVNDGDVYLWWKGPGAGIDFFGDDARAWWHRQQDALLELPINGWKLDFGEEYIPGPTIYLPDSTVDKQVYSEKYYEDFYAYGASKVGGTDEFVTMVRPYDESYGFEGRFFARPEHAPVAWVGDNRRDWVGMVDALDHMFRSAQAGYVVIGSDIGGYLDRDDVDLDELIPFDTLVFARWTALGAMTPFMQLHGRANITPWTVPDNVDETVALYRYWATLHTELVPFWYSLAEEAYAGGEVIVRPIGEAPDDWAGDWRFLVGDAFLVAPIFDATGVRDVALPAGDDWYDWWDTGDSALPGGDTIPDYDATPRDRIPLLIRAGAIIPAEVDSDLTGLGTAAHAGALTVLVYPDDEASAFRLYDQDDAVTDIEAMRAAGTTTVTLSRALRPTILRVRADTILTTVSLNGVELVEHGDRVEFDDATSGWLADAANRRVWVKIPQADGEQVVTLE